MENKKCVLVIDDALPAGVASNTAAMLGITLGKHLPQLVGEDVVDASGEKHLGISTLPVPILKADQRKLRSLRAAASGENRENEENLLLADFSDVAQKCNVYSDYIQNAAKTPEAEHTYYGIALFGDRKKINKLTGNLPLLR